MSATPSNYDRIRATGICASTNKKLEVGEHYIATLVERIDSEAFERMDFSSEAWANGTRPQPPFSLIGFWRTTVPEPGAKKDPLIGTGELMELFDQLADAEEPRRIAFRYILALILIRKRELRLETSDDQCDGGRAMLVRPKGVALPPDLGGDGPPLIVVHDPLLDDAATQDMMAELDNVLDPDALAEAGK